MGFKSLRQKQSIVLPSGVPALIQAMSGKVQRLFTDSKLSVNDKINSVLSDVVISVEGLITEGMDEKKKKVALKKLLKNDRKKILTQSRQLSMGNPEVFELKSKVSQNGMMQVVTVNIELINDETRERIVDLIAKDYDEDMRPVIEQLNQNGHFPTRPYRKQIKSYEDFASVRDIEFKGQYQLQDYDFKFRQLTGEMEERNGIENVNSHSKLLMRALRYREKGSETWLSVQGKDLDELNLPAVGFLSAMIDYYEGDVDTVDKQEDNMGREVFINVIGEPSFFFPNGTL